MRTPGLKIVRMLFRVVAYMMPWLPPLLEREMAYVQGKGFGEQSAGYEAKQSLSVLSNFNLARPIIFDIGANVGDYTEAILDFKKNVQVYAFEPGAKARKILTDRFKEKSQVKVIPLALGNKKTKAILYSNSPASGMASLTKLNLDHLNIQFTNKEKVNVETLDQWVESYGVVPDFIKLDVEGHEFEVFNGGKTTLALTKLLQFEFGTSNIDTKIFFKDLFNFLTKKTFVIYRISPVGLVRIKNYSEFDEFFKPTNYLAIKKRFEKFIS